MPSTKRTTERHGFTLVELLVVITIIGILASLLVPTIAMAVKKSRESAIAFDLKQLQMAMEAFKKERKTNVYPPDFSKDHDANAANRQPALERFVRQNFRNTGPTYVANWVANATDRPQDLDPSEALYFWLALSQKNPESPLPFDGTAEGWSFFDFEQDRLVDADNDGWFEYLPPHGEQVPYVYFESSRYLDPTAANPKPSGYDTDLYIGPQNGYPNAGRVRPYYRQLPPNANTPGDYQAKGTFQIICAGYDGVFGSTPADNTSLSNKAYPAGVGFEEADLDNIATFADGRLDNELD